MSFFSDGDGRLEVNEKNGIVNENASCLTLTPWVEKMEDAAAMRGAQQKTKTAVAGEPFLIRVK